MKSDGVKKKSYSLFRIWDLFVLILILSLVGVVVYLSFVPKEGGFAEVYENGVKIATLPLKKDETLSLHHLTIVVRGGKVWVEDADCPDKICEKTGKIHKKGQAILCLPNKIAIRIVGKGEVDAIV